MAKQKSIFKLEGTIAGVNFYKSQDGYLAREKGGVDGSRIANDPGFARTRENGAEFANAASAGKLIRDVVRPLGKDASDNRVTPRLTQVMANVKNLDDANARGERSAAEGMAKQEAKNLLLGFNFNVKAVLGGVLYKAITTDTETGEITIDMLSPKLDINAPSGASHVIIKSGFAKIDFMTGVGEMTVSDPVRLGVADAAKPFSVKPAKVPAVDGITFILLSIDFVQSVNNNDYSLNNNEYNVLTIVAIE